MARRRAHLDVEENGRLVLAPGEEVVLGPSR